MVSGVCLVRVLIVCSRFPYRKKNVVTAICRPVVFYRRISSVEGFVGEDVPSYLLWLLWLLLLLHLSQWPRRRRRWEEEEEENQRSAQPAISAASGSLRRAGVQKDKSCVRLAIVVSGE